MKHVLPHHSCIAEKVIFHENRPVLIPELWVTGNNYENIVNGFINEGLIKTSDTQPWRSMSDIIVTSKAFFDRLKSTDLISCTIFADEEYFNDLPTFFREDWDSSVNVESMNLLGWTVNKFTEPACYFGFFPIEFSYGDVEQETFIRDDAVLNQYSLIGHFEDVQELAAHNTEIDPYNEVRRVLGVYVDDHTLNKIDRCINEMIFKNSELNE